MILTEDNEINQAALNMLAGLPEEAVTKFASDFKVSLQSSKQPVGRVRIYEGSSLDDAGEAVRACLREVSIGSSPVSSAKQPITSSNSEDEDYDPNEDPGLR